LITRDQLLVLAPRGRDGLVITGQLEAAGMLPRLATAVEIVAAAGAGELAAAIIADEAMALFDLPALAAALAAQPSWSDSLFLILTRREFGGWTRAQLAGLLGNVTTLERPMHGDALISAVRSALRARARQRKAEAYLRDRERAEGQVRELAANLEARVIARNRDLSKALTERAEVESQLRESEQNYRRTIELTAQIPWTADAGGLPLNVGAGWFALTGIPGDRWQEAVHTADLAAFAQAWRGAVATRSPFLADCRMRTATGTYVWCRSRAAPRLGDDGKVLRWYGTLEDIDDRRAAADRLQQMQAELIHVSRLSAMGAMASTLAHELNQPLAAIANYVRGSRRMIAHLDNREALGAALDAADRSTMRAGEIVRRVRDLVTKGDVQCRTEELTPLIQEACCLAMIDARSIGITQRLELDPQPLRVVVDRIQVQQVLLNLLRNAVDAVVDRPIRKIVVSSRCLDEDFVEVTVRDSGPGIAPETAARLFEPFNSSKHDGMGIGLSISRTIVEAHGGQIWSRPTRGGTIFGFTLPRVPLAVAAPAP